MGQVENRWCALFGVEVALLHAALQAVTELHDTGLGAELRVDPDRDALRP